MRTRRFGWGLSVCALLSVLYGVADAQTNKPNPAGDTSVGTQRQVNLSPQEQLAQADSFVARMGVTGANVRRMLEQARAQRDVVKTLCLNDKLNQIDVATRSAQDRRGALEQASTHKDSDLAGHEFTILTVLRQRVEQLGAEANQCIGEEAGFIGETKVTTTVDPNLPKEDPTAYPENPVISVPPVCASCFR
ncbi:MAG TPA: hypothetical protein VJT73_15290 [Polyangiaceae bacterium]|nr:hypothetical protein [Polyangiaceae bacterium]